MKKTLAALVAGAALAAAVAVPQLASAQGAPATACPPGSPQPVTRAFVEGGGIFGASPFITPFGFAHTGFFRPFIGGFFVGDTVIQTENVAGVKGLVQTVVTNGFGAPGVSLGVPSYLLEAYGGNITAIERDLQAGYLKCRSS